MPAKTSKIVEYLKPLIKLKGLGGICSSEKAVEKVNERIKFFEAQLEAGKLIDLPLIINQNEEELLGVSLSAQKINSDKNPEITHSCKDFYDNSSSFSMTFGVDIIEVFEYKTMGGNNAGLTRANMLVSDGTARLKTIIWGDLYEKVSSLCVAGNSIILTGKRGKGNYNETLTATDIRQAK